jgi:hypothetical protein
MAIAATGTAVVAPAAPDMRTQLESFIDNFAGRSIKAATNKQLG